MSLARLFSPRSVAVVGASRKPNTIGYEIFKNLLRFGFTGAAYPVNPSASAVQAVRAYPTVGAIPEPVDLVIVAVPASRVLAVVEECADAGVGAVVVISAGFKESGGGEGEVQENQMISIAKNAGMRLVGPNCLGVINADPGVRLDATFAPTLPDFGRIGFLSQSGALGVAILEYGQALGLGVSTFVSVGNKADINANDMLEYWEQDESTDVILLYLESFGQPSEFARVARRVSHGKPIVMVKSGRSATGQRAASSHTGSMMAADNAIDALCEQTGVIRVDTLEELFNTAMLLDNQPLPRGRRVAVLTNAGGPGILAADACEAFGLELPELSEGLRVKLRAFLHAEAAVSNPVDRIADAAPAANSAAMQIVLECDEVDSLIVIYVPPVVTSPEAIADAIQSAAAGANKPVICNFIGRHGMLKPPDRLKRESLPSFSFPEAAAISLARVAWYGQWRQRPAGEEVELTVDTARADAIFCAARERIEAAPPGEQGAWLSAEECNGLLEAYGIPVAPMGVATSPDEAVRVAQELGFPVALKLLSDQITHKSDVKGVRLGLRSAVEVWDAYAGITSRLSRAGLGEQMRGALVQAMVPGGIELIIGAHKDPSLGQVLMTGLGGIYTELLRDISVRVHPLRDVDAQEMLDGLKGAALLKGYRGSAPADIAAVRDILLRVDRLVGRHPEVVEMDINPLMALPEGEGAVVVDARICVAFH